MARGIDVYAKYQTVTDWAKVKTSGVTFVYVKGSDGGSPAAVSPESYVNGAKRVALPVGLYHYAQLFPTPEQQADVLTNRVRTLGANGMPPALDLESPLVPGPAARSFAQKFLWRLHNNGFAVKALYANTSMLAGIGADTLGVPGVKIWAARYGANNGGNNGLGGYKGHVDIHQYTSVGRVPGITGNVDMNESFTNITPTEGDMQAGELVVNPHTNEPVGTFNDVTYETNNAIWQLIAKVDAGFGQLSDDEATIIAAVRAQPTGAIVDVADLATRLSATLAPDIAAELGRRLLEGNPA